MANDLTEYNDDAIIELEKILAAAINIIGPVEIRYSRRGTIKRITKSESNDEYANIDTLLNNIKNGTDNKKLKNAIDMWKYRNRRYV